MKGLTGASMGGKVISTRRRKHKPAYTKAGEVTIRRADGTTTTEPPLTRSEHRQVVKNGAAKAQKRNRARAKARRKASTTE